MGFVITVLLLSNLIMDISTQPFTNGHCEETNTCEAYVAICTIVKNEHAYLLEWLKYHTWIGIKKFYIYDHDSDPRISKTPGLDDFMIKNKDMVTISEVKGFWPHSSPQIYSYNKCIELNWKKHVFILFIDTDEFVVIEERQPHFYPDITKILRRFTVHGALAVHWKLFGSAGHILRPSGVNSVLLHYDRYIPKVRIRKRNGQASCLNA